MNSSKKSETATAAAIAYSDLGPIYYEFCYRLHLYLDAFRGQDAVALFMTRAGLRLRYIYELFLQETGLVPAIPYADFYTSRLGAAKGCLLKDFDHVCNIILKEFQGATLEYMLKCVVPPLREGNVRALSQLAEHGAKEFPGLYRSGDGVFESVRAYFQEQESYFEEYLADLTKGKRNILLVDSGWEGSTQAMLMRAFPDRQWLGLYWGRWSYKGDYPWHFNDVIGICVDSVQHLFGTPQAAIFEYHHIVESPLEVEVPSVEELQRTRDSGEVRAGIDPVPHEKLSPRPDEHLWAGIIEYFLAGPHHATCSQVRRAADAAYRRLAGRILFPSKSDLSALLVNDRSADFGKSLLVPVLKQGNPAQSFREKINRISSALWRQGQIWIEFPRVGFLILRAWHLYRLVQAWKLKKPASPERKPIWTAGRKQISPLPATDQVYDELSRQVHLCLEKEKNCKTRRIAIFGAAAYGFRLADELSPRGYTIWGFVDNDLRKSGGAHNGIPIFTPDKLQGDEVVVITSIVHREIIRKQLQGLECGKMLTIVP